MKRFNKAVKRFDAFDISLIKLSVLAIVLLIAKYWPATTSLDWYWYIIAFIVFAFRPFKHMIDRSKR